MTDLPIKGTCHCGAVSFEVTEMPEAFVKCNCSICRRLGTLWLHSHRTPSVVHVPDGATIAYHWGDEMIDFHSCKTCGCTTHWQSRIDERHAVNMNLADPKEIAGIRIRHFDGADTWTFLD